MAVAVAVVAAADDDDDDDDDDNYIKTVNYIKTDVRKVA